MHKTVVDTRLPVTSDRTLVANTHFVLKMQVKTWSALFRKGPADAPNIHGRAGKSNKILSRVNCSAASNVHVQEGDLV